MRLTTIAKNSGMTTSGGVLTRVNKTVCHIAYTSVAEFSPPLEPVRPAATSYVPAQPAVMAPTPSAAAPARKPRRLRDAGPAILSGLGVLMPAAPRGA
jgi:hypothetical protein